VRVWGKPNAATAASNQSSGVPMPGIDKATKRVVALIALLVVAAAALRGYLPGGQRTAHEQSTGSPAAMIVVVALLGVSVGIIAIAIIARLRDRRVVSASADGMSDRIRDRWSRPTWRALLITLGVIVAWLLVVLLLGYLFPSHHIDQAPSGTGSSTATPGNGTAPAPRPPAAHAGGSIVGYRLAFLASTVIFLLMLAAGTLVASHRQRRVAKTDAVVDDHSEPETAAMGSESLARAAELGLAEIGDLSREPREAIIACYATMERELAHVPEVVPQDFDTPTEVLARAVEHHALHADSATQLVDLFAEARFSPHVMNEGHREVAVRALSLVLAELRSAA
jgi:hypothetical protein